jgi:putative transposase
VKDFNTTRPNLSLGYQTPAAFGEVVAASGNPIAQPAPQGITEAVEVLIAAG